MLTAVNYKNIKIEQEGVTAILTLHRPDVLNALNAELKEETAKALKELNRDPNILVIIMTGSGEKAFSAGADLNELKKLTAVEGLERSLSGQKLSLQMESLDKPIIAAINGYALGGGCELALACDIRIASEKAKLGQPEVNLGIIPGFGGTQRLPRVVGKGKAMELILTGDIIDAQEALKIGLVEKVVPPEKLMETAKEMAQKIASKGPIAIRLSKKAIHEGLQMDLDRGLALESSYFGAVCSTQDKLEGISAFLEKRKPQFKGE
jgi:enoyl-CoA hydratase